jgi:predicted O-methyltransferase YrrM
MTSWAITPDVARLLCELILDRHPKVIVECGAGSSTLINAGMLRRLNEGGKVYAIESYEGSVEAVRGAVKRHGLESYVELIEAPLREQTLGNYKHDWYDADLLPDISDIDILFVDGPPQYGKSDTVLARYGALPFFISRMRKGSVVVLDDGARPTERETARRWAAEYGVEMEVLEGFAKGVILLHVQ